MRPKVIHKDGSICHNKSVWASFNKTPPLKDFKLLDLFPDKEYNSELTGKSQNRPTSSKPVQNKNKLPDPLENMENSATINTGNTLETIETEMDINSHSVEGTKPINTEKDGDQNRNSAGISDKTMITSNNMQSPDVQKDKPRTDSEPPARHAQEPEENFDTTENSKDLQTAMQLECEPKKLTESTPNSVLGCVNTENIGKVIDTPTEEEKITNNSNTTSAVNAENSDNISNTIDEDDSVNKLDSVTTEICHTNNNKENANVGNECDKDNDSTIPELHVNNQNTTKQTTSSPNKNKEDWDSLMFNSDDSLFDELTRQMNEPSCKDNTNATVATSTITSNEDFLPDLIQQQNKSDAVTRLLLLGAMVNASIDDQIDNELLLPVDKPKQPDYSKKDGDKSESSVNKNDSNNRSTKVETRSKRKTRRKNENKPKSTSKPTNEANQETSEYPTSPKSPGLPRGVLHVTRYKLKKGKVNTYQERKVKCSMCNRCFDTKEELYDHQKCTQHCNMRSV